MGSADVRPAPIRLLRTEDLLDLWFGFPGLTLERVRGQRVLVRADPAREGWIVVTFGPQHVAERAFFEVSDGLPAPDGPSATEPRTPPPVPTRIAGRSVLVFVVGAGATIPYSEAGLLGAMQTLELRVVDAARAPAPAGPPVTVQLGQQLAQATGGEPFGRAATTLRKVRALAELAGRYDAKDALGAVLGTDLVRPAPAAEPAVTAEGAPSAETAVEPAAKPRPENPLSDVDNNPRTGIELPYRLLLSPPETTRWRHRVEPPATGPTDRVELWHTRADTTSARAVWTRDPGFDPEHVRLPPHGDDPFRMALDANDRAQIVHLTSNHNLTGGDTGPVRVDHLMLSALGGWLDSIGRWRQPPPDFNVSEWRHRASVGRDHYVRVMYAGRLCPFGHRAALVKVTERKFDRDREDNAAYLYQRMYILVREPVLTFTDKVLGDGDPKDRLDLLFPFTSVELLTLVTPDLAPPWNLDGVPSDRYGFFPETQQHDEKPFRFKVRAIDRDGRAVEFLTPLLFVDNILHADNNELPKLVKKYNACDSGASERPPPSDASVRFLRAEVRGQTVAMAPSRRADDGALDVADLVWGAEAPSATLARDHTTHPRFVPRVRWARAVLPQVRELSAGGTQERNRVVAVRYPKPYAKHGFEAGNAGELFAELVHPLVMNFHDGSDRSGALVSPTFTVAGVSRKTGPVAARPVKSTVDVAREAASTEADAFDWAALAAGRFDPSAFFAQALGDRAKLFGVLRLVDLLRDAVGLDRLKAPAFVTETVNAVTGFLSDLGRLRDVLADTERRFPEIVARVVRVTDAAAILARTLTAHIVGQLANDPNAPTFAEVENAVTAFDEALAALIAVLPPQVDPAVRTLLDRVRQQVATWDNAVGDAMALKRAVTLAARGVRLPDVVNARLEWQPDLRNWPPDNPIFKLGDDNPSGHCSLVVDLRGSLRPDVPSGADITCTLENFSLLLVPYVLQGIELRFDRIRFTTRVGRKPDIEVRFGGVRFVKELSFVDTLRRLIPLDGFSDPPALRVTPTGISARYSIPLPNAAVGVFSLENLSLNASLEVPFLGSEMEIGFAFCRREAPFRLTVSMLGGGGYFGIVLSPDRIVVLDAALEFGAAVSMNFGVASGSLSVMAGIYFRLGDRQAVKLVGYFRARGEVDVLGIVSASVELYLEIGYDAGQAVGRASLTISIEIGFFSKSVTISCEKRFAGSPTSLGLAAADPAADPAAVRPPTFAELMSPYPDPVTGQRRDPVLEYCTAFAEVS
ncbi:hypothetical protein [Streptoalloteichus hindustanus]|uniref:hypothetical protein n=1 Tax=Streptoalloteichus hindustanus TaxID=2017 RepID=UPI001161022D|nr:hypothetical protein [Streptoalloteichus hindustanus]